MKEILERENEIAMAGETLMHISQDEIEFARLTTELKNVLDYQSGMLNAHRAGHAEGLQDGEQKKAQEIARKMKNAGRTINEIEEFTGLSPDIIQQVTPGA